MVASPREPANTARRWSFIATALLEVGAGLGMLGVPGLAVALLFGVREPSPETLVIGRVAGTALLAIGVACWLARDDRASRAQQGLLWGVVLYHLGTCAVLATAGVSLSMAGTALWPVALLHAVMAIWCAVSLRASGATAR